MFPRAIAAIALTFGSLICVIPAEATPCVSSQESQTIAAAESTVSNSVRTIETCGGDDISYQVPLTTTVTFDGQTFESVYATTNSVITFGRPDGTYWNYPGTPSISLYSMDWVVYPNARADEHLIIATSDGGFQVDISARPIFLQSAPEATNINIVAAINADGTVAISYSLTGPDYAGYNWLRTGVRLTNGDIVTLEEYGIIQVEEPPVLTPEPVAPIPEPTPVPVIPEPTPTVTPTPEPTPEPTPITESVRPITDSVRPIEPPAGPVEPPSIPSAPEVPAILPPATPSTPEPEIAPEIPEETPEPEDTVLPEIETPSPTPSVEEPTVEPIEEPIIEQPAILYEEITAPTPTPSEEPVEIPTQNEPEPVSNPEPSSVQQAITELALEAEADDPTISEELAAIPVLGAISEAVLEAFNAIGNVGADMRPQVREQAEKVVVGAIIAGQIASVSIGSVSMRRIK